MALDSRHRAAWRLHHFQHRELETVRLLEDHRQIAAALNGLGMLIVGTAAAALGFGIAPAATR